jgi:hypothetical protein
MTEREWRSTDQRRLEWLSDALLGPPLRRARPLVPSGTRHTIPLALRRLAIAAALGLERHARLNRIYAAPSRPPLERASRRIIA